MNRHTWHDEIYDTSIVLLHGEWPAARAWMDETFHDITDAEVGQGTGAKTLWIERSQGCALVLWFPAWFHTGDSHYLGVLAHECFHAAEFVLGHRGCAVTDASSEAYAYYIAWMFRSCHAKLSETTNARARTNHKRGTAVARITRRAPSR